MSPSMARTTAAIRWVARCACCRAIAGTASSAGSSSTPVATTGLPSTTSSAGTRRSTSRTNNPPNGRKSKVLTTLKTVWALAIWRGVSAASLAAPVSDVAAGDIQTTSAPNRSTKPIQTATPRTLKRMWTRLACTAVRGLPIEASAAVTQVPMLAPKMRVMPAVSEISPWLAMAMTTPVVADEDCTRPVKAAARRIPNSGFSMRAMVSMKPAWLRNGSMAMLIRFMPKKMSPSPMTSMPYWRRLPLSLGATNSSANPAATSSRA